MKLAVLAPIDNSPFARTLCRLCREEPGVDLAAIVVRRILNPRRLANELRRDGVRLVRKAWAKLIVAESADRDRAEVGFEDLALRHGMQGVSLSSFARRNGIPLARVGDHNDAAAIDLLRRTSPDVVAFTGGGILRGALLDVAGRGVLNAHMGPLPTYRGMDVVEWPILEDRVEEAGLGVTLHFMARGIDTGPIVGFRAVPIHRGDDMQRLRRRFEPAMLELMLEGIRALRDDRVVLRPQTAAEGRQYFLMHPRLYAVAREKLARLQERVPAPVAGV